MRERGVCQRGDEGAMLLHLSYEQSMEPLKSISRRGRSVQIQSYCRRGCISMRSWKYFACHRDQSARQECSGSLDNCLGLR